MMCIIANVFIVEDEFLNNLAHIIVMRLVIEDLWNTHSLSSFDRLDESSHDRLRTRSGRSHLERRGRQNLVPSPLLPSLPSRRAASSAGRLVATERPVRMAAAGSLSSSPTVRAGANACVPGGNSPARSALTAAATSLRSGVATTESEGCRVEERECVWG
jgi:hypothetical protein